MNGRGSSVREELKYTIMMPVHGIIPVHVNNLKDGPIAQNIQDTLLKQLKKLEKFNIKKAKKAMAFSPNFPLGWPFCRHTLSGRFKQIFQKNLNVSS